ncbi:MAG: polyphosphate polymerase domain-containing protein [Acidaminobacteraceae bacterium]
MDNLFTKRHEIKHTITNHEYLIYMSRLDKVLKRDDNCKDNSYTITSLYYDDINDSALHEKLSGDAIRHKYRLRYYEENTSFIKLEQKSKIHQMTNKESAFIGSSEAKSILSNDFSLLDYGESALKNDFLSKVKTRRLMPKVIVRYERIAFVHRVGNLRITFDTNVRSSTDFTSMLSGGSDFKSVIDPGLVIMEIKFDGVMPDHIKGLIESERSMASSSSKYVLSRLMQDK